MNTFVKGSSKIQKTYIGDFEAKKICLGGDIIWPSYDAELDYIETDGYAYIDLPYIPKSHTKVEVKFKPISDSVSLTYAYIPIGASIAYQNKNFQIYAPVNSNTDCYICLGNTSKKILLSNMIGSDHTIIVAQDNSTAYINGTGYSVNGTGDFTYTIPFRLFRANENNNTPTSLHHKLRIYYVTIYENNVKQMELIPVRIGQVGYMYDKINNVLYGNSGSGNLILGNDIQKVEYLESTGTQYIDTLLGINLGQEIHAVMMSSGNEYRPNGSQAFFGQASTFKSNAVECWSHNTYFAFDFGTQYSDNNGSMTLKTKYEIIYKNKAWVVKNEDGTINCTKDYSSESSFTPPYTMVIFGNHRASVGVTQYPTRCYSFKILDENGNYLMDMIPVRAGQIGYMYDKVTGRLFGNAGTGNFVLGPDI